MEYIRIRFASNTREPFTVHWKPVCERLHIEGIPLAVHRSNMHSGYTVSDPFTGAGILTEKRYKTVDDARSGVEKYMSKKTKDSLPSALNKLFLEISQNLVEPYVHYQFPS